MQDMTLEPNMAPAGGKPRRGNPMIWGLILIVGGLVMLLANMGYFESLGGLFAALLAAAGGAVFLYFFLRNTQKTWWAAIPGCTLLGLAGTIFLSEYAPAALQPLIPASILGGIGLGFFLVYAVRREFWWAMIPGGVMFSVAATAFASETGRLSGDAVGGLMVFGLGVTFLLVAMTGREFRTRRWAYIPAGILLLIGTLLSASMTRALETLGYVWPAVLIVIGGWLLYLALSRRES